MCINYKKSRYKLGWKYQFVNEELVTICSLFGNDDVSRRIPGFVFDLPVSLLQAFLEGYTNNDGSLKNRNKCLLTTISREFAYGFGQCISKVYHVPFSISKGCDDAYRVRYSLVGYYEDGYIWAPVRSVENTGEKEMVYDIEVKTDHSFTANGMIAHNCQDFSNEGMNNVNTGRSILFERTLQIIDPEPNSGAPELSRQPKVVIWENVPGLLWKFKDCLDYYLEVMEDFGYVSYYDVLRASDYNIPQNRDRVFVVSILKSIDRAEEFTFPAPMIQKWKLKDFIDTSVSFNDPAVQLTNAEKSIFGMLPNGTLTVKEGTKKGYAEVNEWQIINVAIPTSKNRRGRVGDNAKTITTMPRQAIYYNGNVRMLTAKEYLRLMGFKDVDYEKMKNAGITDKQISFLAGNSICVPVLEAIFRQLISYGILCAPSETYGK